MLEWIFKVVSEEVKALGWWIFVVALLGVSLFIGDYITIFFDKVRQFFKKLLS